MTEEWQNVEDGQIYVMVLKSEFQRLHEKVALLTAALIAGRATHGEVCHLGDDCQFMRDANKALL